jgi:hypothetical protein
LQPAGGVDDEHIGVFALGGRERFVGKACGIGADLARNDFRADAGAPDFKLLDGGGAECVASGEHDVAALSAQFRRELTDGRGLARAVDADDEDHEWLGRTKHEGSCHRRQNLLNLGGQHRFHFVGGNGLVEAAFAQHSCDAAGGLDAQIGADQHLFDFSEHGSVELALGDEIGNRTAER